LREKRPPKKWTQFRWIAPGILATAWGLRMTLFTDFPSMVDNIMGMVALGILVWVAMSRGGPQMAAWDSDRGVMALFHPWSVEVIGACVITSVPLGLDLTHSGRRALQMLDVYLEEEEDDIPRAVETLRVQIRFFVTRPLGRGPTKVGMMVSRKTPRIPGARRVERVADQVMEGVQVIEGALRSAYPHTPVSRASPDDLLIVMNGGILVNAECD
jgi:hypothetical protein